jgi:opacity protein-like surface antigen
MMRTCSVVLFALMFAASMCSAAQWAGRAYVGGGLLYSIERFTSDITSIDDSEGHSSDLDFDNTWGLFAKGGYFVMEDPVIVAVEGLARYHHEYKASDSETADLGLGLGGVSADVDFKIKGYDLTVNAKAFLPIDAPVMPYGVAGIGYARFKAEGDISVEGAGVSVDESDSETESGVLARIGAGCDYFFDDNFGVEGEVSYNHCFNDLKGLNFVDFTVGVIYAF